ncbi:efflux RND transporter periplasmic adaptor subunit [Rubripirellula lacrimiformis]|nr:efflux RND transporter periplasmic adaptor subunit [Rubripirellula lacrimiformis]
MPDPTVTIATPIKKVAVEWDAYSGRLEPIEFVEVRARVSGYLESIHFDEGRLVNQGDLLFVIDPRPFDAELRAAQASLSQAKSQLKQAESGLAQAKATQSQTDAAVTLADARVQRARTLMERNATSQEEVDQREAEFLQAKADMEASVAGIQSAEAAIATANAAIESANAGVQTAELNLAYTRIESPVTGRISREYVTEGNLVSGGSATATLLTTITSVEPIYCTFDATEQEVLKYSRLAKSGERESSRVAKNPVFLGLVDEDGFPHQGHMDFVDNRFDTDTASMRARCIFRNEDQLLLPGMFARIRIPGSAPRETVLIPDSAIGTDQSSQYVYIVVDNTIERRQVTPGPMLDGLRVIRTGLEGDESVVIEGLLQVRPETKVKTQAGEVLMIEDGLPDTYTPLTPDEWIKPDLNDNLESKPTQQQTVSAKEDAS